MDTIIKVDVETIKKRIALSTNLENPRIIMSENTLYALMDGGFFDDVSIEDNKGRAVYYLYGLNVALDNSIPFGGFMVK